MEIEWRETMPGSDYQQQERIRTLEVNPANAEAIAESVIPYYTDDTNKAKYLKFRVANFSVAESCKLAGLHIKTIRRWRASDPNFYAIDVTNIGNIREKLSARFLDAEWSRNFTLILQKDFDVITKALDGAEMSELDQQYFLRVRGHYTPQNLAMIKQLLGGGTLSEPFNYTKMVMTFTKEKQIMEIKTE
jgi:hypothetical protein